jgi:2-dehydropantoate 2-reductase
MTNPDGRLLVWGAGAIGGTVAAFLRRSGIEVAIVDANAAHVAAIRDRGLTITGPIETFTQAIPAFLPDDIAGRWPTIFLCVKALHTEAAIRQLEPHLAADGIVVSLQNGFNEIAIAKVVGSARTIGAFVNFGADLIEPGVVQFGGRGAVVVGELDGRLTTRVDNVRRIFSRFEPAAETTANIWGYLWGKMGYGAILFATALTDATIVDVLSATEVRPALAELAREVTMVAKAEGVVPMKFNGYDPFAFDRDGSRQSIDASFEAMIAFNRRSAKTHTGVWRDIAVHHRQTEADAQFGPILEIARRRGMAVPHLERLVALVGEVERGARRQTFANLAELAAVDAAATDAYPL